MARTAVVLSGGGSLGAVQVGMLLALADHDVAPDLLVGTSVGAINGAFVAGHPGRQGAEALADLWRAVRRSDIFPVQPMRGLLALTGRGNHLVAPVAFRHLLEQHVGYRRLEDAARELCLVAAEVTTGRQSVLSHGPVVDAVMASAAVPGVFPPVRFAQQELMDGAVANSTPISVAVEAGAQTVYVLHAGYACALGTAPRSALGMALHALTLILQQRLLVDAALYRSAVQLRVAPPLCPLGISPADFRHNHELITRAQESTRKWLADGAPSDPRYLQVHAHQ
ncbi:patatin-like phospholipase family protein [Streptomyces dysideae]|uniref:Alpha/beta hydrolase n=1 Tax=Streptomyces dysideae TaxID=909626 RepID=A0A101UP70_9ACTN|nr:patatin-like phospholipase family protein [Streptomyces dysideae]KUO14280.1 alpha/beta hydrolase [Streptomyces dysideae]